MAALLSTFVGFFVLLSAAAGFEVSGHTQKRSNLTLTTERASVHRRFRNTAINVCLLVYPYKSDVEWHLCTNVRTQWEIFDMERIKHTATGKCMDISQFKEVVVTACDNNKQSQIWTIQANPPRIMSSNNKCVTTVGAFGATQMADCITNGDDKTQRWVSEAIH